MIDQRYRQRDVELLAENSGYDGFYKIRKYRLRHKQFAGDWGEPIQRELFQRHEAAGALLYDPVLDKVGLLEQFRVGAWAYLRQYRNNDAEQSPWLLELVAGLLDKDEQPEDVVKREAIEEAGVSIQQLEPICDYYSSPGGTDEYFYLYCGKADLSNAGGVHGLPEEGEDIRVHVVSFDECCQLLQQGRLNNVHLLLAVQWLQMHRDRLRESWR